MRLLLLTTERGFRGGEAQLALCAGELSARGHSLHLAAPANAAVIASVPAARHHPWKPRNDLDLFAARRLKSLAREVMPDVVHAFTPRAQAIARLALRGGPPLVASRLVAFPAGKGLGGRFKYRGVARYAAVSEAAADALVAAGVPREQVALVPSALAPEFLPRRREPLGCVVGCVAALAPGKGHRELLEAAVRLLPRFPALELRLIGDGPERRRLALRGEKLGLTARLRFLGALPPAGVARELAALTVFVLPSYSEGLGVAILEAMAVGVPVVATRVGGIREIVKDGVNGRLVPAGDPARLAEAIGTLLASPPERSRLASTARNVVARHGVGLAADALEALYRSAVAPQRRLTPLPPSVLVPPR